jgi:hypothetical protein
LIGGSAKPPLDEEFLRMHPKKKIDVWNIYFKLFLGICSYFTFSYKCILYCESFINFGNIFVES